MEGGCWGCLAFGGVIVCPTPTTPTHNGVLMWGGGLRLVAFPIALPPPVINPPALSLRLSPPPTAPHSS